VLFRSAAALDHALGVEPAFYNDADVRTARSATARVSDQLARVTERMDALRRQLPSDADQAAAEATVRELSTRIDAAQTRGREAWTRLLPALLAAETIARELVAARTDSATAIAQLTDVAGRYGLHVAIPSATMPPSVEVTLATHLAMALADISQGDAPRETVERYLRSARADHDRHSAVDAA